MKVSYLLATLLAAGVVACGKDRSPGPGPRPEGRGAEARRGPGRPPTPGRRGPRCRRSGADAAKPAEAPKADAKPAEAPKK